MTDRPTPEEIALRCQRATSTGLQMQAIAGAIQAEREEADRRVAEEREDAINFLIEEVSDDFRNPDGADLVRELAARIERGEHRQRSTPSRVVDVPGCACEDSNGRPCPLCVRYFERGEHRE